VYACASYGAGKPPSTTCWQYINHRQIISEKFHISTNPPSWQLQAAVINEELENG